MDAVVSNFKVELDASGFTPSEAAAADPRHPPFYFTLSGFTVNNDNSKASTISVEGHFPQGSQIDIRNNVFILSGGIRDGVLCVLLLNGALGTSLRDGTTLQFVENNVSLAGTSPFTLSASVVQIQNSLGISNASGIGILRNTFYFNVARTGGTTGYVAAVHIHDTLKVSEQSYFTADQMNMHGSLQSDVLSTALLSAWLLFMSTIKTEFYNGSTFAITNNTLHVVLLTGAINLEVAEVGLVLINAQTTINILLGPLFVVVSGVIVEHFRKHSHTTR